MSLATTTVAAWGNSDAIRIPKGLMQQAGLHRGDTVVLQVNEPGSLELRRCEDARQEHRRVRPKRDVRFEELFAGYTGGQLDNTRAWPQDELQGAERGAWES